jgi:streptogramin lyase
VSVSADPRIGSELLGYRIEALVGRGGMGVVYQAHDLRLKRKVALKLVAPEFSEEERFRERFLAETQLAASLEHPNVVPIYDAGEVDGQLYLAMRYVKGQDLKTLLKHEGALEPTRAIAICGQIADALDSAHARALVHRDVKPSNVLLDAQEHVYLADFGLSRRLGEYGVTAGPGLSLGTPAYAAPEQIQGAAVDGRADVYALACVLYECLTGDIPFPRGSELAVLWAHLHEEPRRPSACHSGLPGTIDVFMAKALAKEPERRYRTCGELVDSGREALGIAKPARSRWLQASVLVIFAGLLAIAAATYFGVRGGGEVQGRRDTLVRIDPATNKVVDSIPVGPHASSVTFGDGYLWTTSYEDRTVWRIDPATGETQVTEVKGGAPQDVAVQDNVAVVTYGLVSVGFELLDATSGASEWSYGLPGAGGAPAPVAAGPAGIWVAASGFDGENVGVVRRGSAVSGAAGTFNRVPIPQDPNFVFFYTPDSGSYNDVAVGSVAVWLVRDTGSLLKRIDPKARRVVATIELPFKPKSLAVSAGAVWVTAIFEDTLARLDPRTNQVTLTVSLPPGTDGVAVGYGSVWVASTVAGRVTRLDPRTGETIATIDVGKRPEDVAVGNGSVWVTTHTA